MKVKAKTVSALSLIIAAAIFLNWQNNYIVITEYRYVNPRIPQSFDGYKIVQISDLHNKDFHGSLVKKIVQINPDLIVNTGDLIYRRASDFQTAMETVAQIKDIAPVYFVSGNHEWWSGKYHELKKELLKNQVVLLDNDYQVLVRGQDKIGLLGLADPALGYDYPVADDRDYAKIQLRKLLDKSELEDVFLILLSHRPELFPVYKEMNLHLVFSGHAHGGQVRLPLIGGLVAPNQGFLPKYTAGIYREEGTSMVVSRGLGNSIFPLRIFNPPELVVITLGTG